MAAAEEGGEVEVDAEADAEVEGRGRGSGGMRREGGGGGGVGGERRKRGKQLGRKRGPQSWRHVTRLVFWAMRARTAERSPDSNNLLLLRDNRFMSRQTD